MKARSLIILIAVLVFVAGYFFLVEERQRRDADDAKRSSRMLLPYGPLDIDAVSFINPYGETIQWERVGDGWMITFPVTDIGEKSTIDMFLGQIAPGQKLEEFSEEEARTFARRAVGEGRLESGDETFLLRVGKQHPLRLQVAAWHLFEARQRDAVDFGSLADQAAEEIAGMMKQQ